MKALLVDGYVDEPAALGVPPYVSPYIRYTYGALLLKGFSVDYYTIDQLREIDHWSFDHDVIVIYGGTTVPGHYFSGTPILLSEVSKIIENNKSSKIIIGGPITRAYTIKGGTRAIKPHFENAISSDAPWTFILGRESKNEYDVISEASLAGSELIKHHPFFPNVICEIEVSKGCERKSFCSFCTEPVLHGKLVSRPVDDIVKETAALYKSGCRAFRLGRSSNIIAYMSDRNGGKPDPGALEELYSGIRDVAPELEVLHTDNANPGYIVSYKEVYRIIEIIVKYNTPGDVLSFGVESFDKNVIEKNNIGVTPEQVMDAVKIVNEIGGLRIDGVPKLLPGINLLYGLIGETENTYKINYEYLKKILENVWLLRRINIRQVMVYPDTPLFYYYRRNKLRINKKIFNYWKKKIRKEIDVPMIKKVFPKGCVIKGVIPEKKKGKVTFGRPLGTYPILVGSYSDFTEKTDMIVVSHGRRSVTAVKYPFDINNATYEELSSIEGLGEGRVREIIMKRPFNSKEEIKKRLNEDTYKAIKPLLEV